LLLENPKIGGFMFFPKKPLLFIMIILLLINGCATFPKSKFEKDLGSKNIRIIYASSEKCLRQFRENYLENRCYYVTFAYKSFLESSAGPLKNNLKGPLIRLLKNIKSNHSNYNLLIINFNLDVAFITYTSEENILTLQVNPRYSKDYIYANIKNILQK
jgi:hypothetical protein